MFAVLEAIDFRDKWMQHYRHKPDFSNREEGVVAVLDPHEIIEPPDIAGRIVKVFRPDGSTIVVTASHVETCNSIIGIFFKGIFSNEIPKGSKIKWE